jgi:protoporphyrin/coproporphyrin ferrochelatase
MMTMKYDAVLMVTFGGPDTMDDVMPFLENVLRGKNVPRERMLEVAHHYELFSGKSPINEQNAALKRLLEERMETHAPKLPVYIGNRNWHPYVEDTIRQMMADGVQRAVAFVASGYSCYSGCRQYREDIIRAREAIGEGAPTFDKLRVFFNHPLFVKANADHVRAAFERLPENARADAPLIFTAHSIPMAMAEKCRYQEQLEWASRLVAEAVGHENWRLVFQSRSGPPHQPWLEPDVCDVIEELHADGVRQLVISPVGFTSDHMEVLFDLDTEAKELCEKLGMQMERAAAAGCHPAFVEMVHDLIAERLEDRPERPALGAYGPSHDVCPENCCMPR